MKEEEIKFQLNLTVLLECLNVFGSNKEQSGTSPALKFYFNGHGTPVTILYVFLVMQSAVIFSKHFNAFFIAWKSRESSLIVGFEQLITTLY